MHIFGAVHQFIRDSKRFYWVVHPSSPRLSIKSFTM
jgi:hypothetical protein